VLWTHLVPATMEGKAWFNVQNAMFATVMAHALGIRIEDIRQGLRTYDSSYFQAPGRLNVFHDHPFKVILDYGHNPPAGAAVAELCSKLKVDGRRICVLAGPGDRRNEDLREMARIGARHFDELVLRRDDDLRGRGPDEVPRLMEKEVLAAGYPAARLHVIPDGQGAVDAALRMARRGDLVLIFGDKVSRCWKQVIYFKPEDAEPPAPREEVVPVVPDLSAAAFVQDERGVRLARQSDD